jgi:hypothetical protein
MGLRLRTHCLYCETELINDPAHSWRYCPKCEVNYLREITNKPLAALTIDKMLEIHEEKERIRRERISQDQMGASTP